VVYIVINHPSLIIVITEMNHRDNGNNAQPNSPGGGIIKEKSLNDKGNDKKPKSQKNKLKEPKDKPENQKPKAEAKQLPQGFTALDTCRITESNKFLRQQQILKPIGESVYPNLMAVAINFIDNQEERSKRANTNNRRNTNKNGGDADEGEDAQVKMANAVEDNEQPSTSDDSDADVSEENGGKSDTGGNAIVTTAYATPAGDEWHRTDDVNGEFDWGADGKVTYTYACDEETPGAENNMGKGNEPQPEKYVDEGSEPRPEERWQLFARPIKEWCVERSSDKLRSDTVDTGKTKDHPDSPKTDKVKSDNSDTDPVPTRKNRSDGGSSDKNRSDGANGYFKVPWCLHSFIHSKHLRRSTEAEVLECDDTMDFVVRTKLFISWQTKDADENDKPTLLGKETVIHQGNIFRKHRNCILGMAEAQKLYASRVVARTSA